MILRLLLVFKQEILFLNRQLVLDVLSKMKILVPALFACANAQNLQYDTVGTGNMNGFQWTSRDIADCNGVDQRIMSNAESALNNFRAIIFTGATNTNAQTTPAINAGEQYGHCAATAGGQDSIPVAFNSDGSPSTSSVAGQQKLLDPSRYTKDEGAFFRFIPKLLIADVREKIGTALNSVKEGRNLYNSIVNVLNKVPILKNSNKYRTAQQGPIDETARGNMTADSSMDFFHYYCVDYTSQEANTYLQCYMLWEGNIETCATEHSFDVQQGTFNKCTLQGASDYCRKRGGELAWSEDIEMSAVAAQTGDFNHASNNYDTQDKTDIKQWPRFDYISHQYFKIDTVFVRDIKFCTTKFAYFIIRCSDIFVT